ncbi:TPA: 7-cyano-7-deazaguanine synthase [Pasteurella multocida]|uniref:7-cyano-7-deazaguanine synthase n=1 Tax=Pasteurella multocida TaxID=747 RepID=UPI0032F295A8|nr:7-cyano-7-deazaguanine synthase [Pasteurella multocida]HDR1432932.1 7-cyano-7-deazaguanine synthase [Pasteurella multocida]HDR1791951.1 7-cyano-7-deazaguanine synthase [Pasteurella multocida]HDR1830065.1 7-cyano-7-deazaguanine synthase [Pasteurella multocida]HDR1857133.1 7-cyano-7-deazaguanine synthase [Pasteurella multocida]
MKSAILLSGGMDSLSLAWWKKPDLAFTINYGQLSAETEIEISEKICKELNIEHHIIVSDLSFLGSGDLSGKTQNIHAPATDWWPYRNQMLITLAGMKAISLDVGELWIGCVKSDSQHVDGSIMFIDTINALMQMQEGGIKVKAPAIHLTTEELVICSGVPKSFLSWAHSCHKSNIACGNCRGCNKYLEIWNKIYEKMD